MANAFARKMNATPVAAPTAAPKFGRPSIVKTGPLRARKKLTAIARISLPSRDIEEVLEFEKLDSAYEAYKKKHASVIAPLVEIATQRNAARAAAEKSVREAEVECGPFAFHREPSVAVDGAKLVEEIGEEQFLELGGTKETTVVYKMDAELLDKRVAENRVEQALAEAVIVKKFAWRSVKDILL